MNNSSTPRQWALAALTFACLVTSNVSFGQCSLTSGPTPVQIQAFLDPVNGEFQLTHTLLFPAYLQSGCPITSDAQVKFYVDATKTTPYTPATAPLTFGCGDVNSPTLLYVSVWDGLNPTSESPTKAVQVTVFDNTPPDLEVPADVTLNTAAGQCTVFGGTNVEMLFQPRSGLAPTFLPNPGEYTDNCGADLIYDIVFPDNSVLSGSGDASGVAFPLGTSTVTYTVIDVNTGLDVSESFTVTVEDHINPVITCPSNFLVANDLGFCSADVSFASVAPTGDNCSTTTISWQTIAGPTVASGSGSSAIVNFDFGVTTVEFDIEDGSGNVSSCTFDVEVYDNEEPTLICPPDVTVEADPLSLPIPCEYTVNGSEFDPAGGDYFDNCPGVLMPPVNDYNTTSSMAGEVLPVGTYVIQWMVEDANLNVGTCEQIITVEDTTVPLVSTTYVGSYSVNVTPGDCSAAVTVEQANNVPFNYSASDCSGIISLTRGTPTVNGIPKPTLFNAIPAFNPNDPLNRIFVLQFPVGTTVIPYYWEDGNGNIETVNITVVVNENIPPMAQCKNTTISLANNGIATLVPADINNNSTDNCGVQGFSASKTSFTCANLGANTVTLTVSDNAGLTSTCVATVTVLDVTPASIICPASLTQAVNQPNCKATVASLGMVLETNPANLGNGEFYDNSFACPSLFTVSYSVNGGAFSNISGLPTQQFSQGSSSVTIRVVGPANIPATCSFTVTVDDQTPPTVVCPANITTTVPIGGCTKIVSWPTPSKTDNCTASGSITLSSNFSSGSSFPAGTYTVQYNATDASGNVGTCSFQVVVNDNQPPIAKCKPFTAVLNASGTKQVYAININDNSTDNCGYDTISVTRPGNLPAVFTCADVNQTIPVVLTIRDAQPNTATCTAQVTVLDQTAPVVSCASVPATVDLNTNANPEIVAATYGTAYAIGTDNCTTNYSVAVAQSTSATPSAFAADFNFDCSWVGAGRVLIFRVSDNGGNAVTCSKIVTVRDVTPPTLTAPANITVSCDVFNASQPSTSGGTPTGIADNCTWTPSTTNPSYSDVLTVPPVGNCPNKTFLRTWLVTDVAGNTATATQQIRVEDNKKPKFLLPANVIINTDAAQCFATYTAKLTATDIIDTCSAFNQMSFEYRIVYPAGSAPTWNDVTVFTAAPTAQVPFTTFPIGNTVVTWRATDACGNTQSFSVTVQVKDSNPPVFASYNDNTGSRCGKTYTLPNTSGSCAQLFSWNRPIPANITDCKPITVSETFSDTTVRDFINLVNPFSWPAPGVSVTAQFPVGSTTVTYLATDQAGNTTPCTFTVKIVDTQAPVITCPPKQTLAATCPDAQLPDYRNLVMVADNCPLNVNLSQSPSFGTSLGAIAQVGLHVPPQAGDSILVTITANDNNPANQRICTFKVKLADGNAPIPDKAALNDTVSYCGVIVIPAPTAKDLCNPGALGGVIYGTPSAPVGTLLAGIPPRYQLIIPTGLYVQNYVITWVYDDGFGNVSSQLQNITVYRDTFAPEAICKPGYTLNLSAAGTASIGLSDINNGSNDPDGCGPITLEFTPSGITKSFTCANIGANIVHLKVTDANGNTASCNTVVTIADNTKPVLSPGPLDVTIEACAAIPAPATITAIDACTSNVPVVLTQVSTQDPMGGYDKYNYTITRTWVATDGAGNSSSGSQVLTISDTKAPVFAAATPDTIIQFTDGISTLCGDTVNFNITPYVTDCATGADLAIVNDLNPLQLGNLSAILSLGFHTVHFLAEDISGNTASYTLVIEVRDGTPPTAVCINGVSASLQPSGTVLVNTAQFNNNSFDNCTGALDLKIQRLDASPLQTPSATLLYGCADADAVTHHPVKLYVKDQAGNESTCLTYIIIQDNVAPMITTCPAGQTIDCAASTLPASLGSAVATDNCPASVTISYSDVPSFGTGSICKVLTRTWKAVDPVGNSATCVQVINIKDTQAPTFNLTPQNITISCNDALVAPPVVTATDNCSSLVNVNLDVDTIGVASGACAAYSYTVRRTWTATDDCGNVAAQTQLVKVKDDTAPQFLGMPDTLVFLSANYTGNLFCEVPVSYDVAQHLFDCTPSSAIQAANDAPFGNGVFDISGNYPVGEYWINFVAQDVCGNVGVDSMLLQVIDNTTPTMVCNDMIVISLGSNGEASIQTIDVDLGSTDNCGIASLALSQSIFDCSDLGPNVISLTATDINGNTNLCNVTVNVTLGAVAGFTLTTTGTPESYFGADNGTATTIVSGGVGPFQYNWSTGASVTNLTNLAAGVYTITVLDQGNGCVQVDTAVVDAGSKITLNIGSVNGCQGQTVSVPVTVDHFNNVNGFQFGLQLANTAVGTITGVSNVNPALAGFNSINGNPFTVFWPNPTAVTLNNGALLFNVNIQLSAAAIGTSSALLVPAIPGIVFSQDSAGVPVQATAVVLNNGTVSINCAVADKIIEGDIRTWKTPTVAVPGVNVALTGTVVDNEVTTATGIYNFSLPSGANTLVTPTKSVTSAFNSGINVGDLLLIQTHATPVLNQPITNPYALLAGDINGDKNVNLIDYLLVQQLILGTVQHYSNGAPDWKFVPTAYTFPSPNPLNPAPPSTIAHSNVTTDFLNDDFVAVRMGDVTGNAPVNNIMNNGGAENVTSDLFKFRLADQHLEAGQTYTVAFRAADFINRKAYQLTLAFDPNVMELLDINPGALPGLNNDNFGLAHLADGYLTTLWVNNKPLSLSDNTVLFTLTFKALNNADALSKVLRVGSEITQAEALNEDGESMPIDLEFTSVATGTSTATASQYVLFQNQPNPFSEQTTIGFRLPEASRATLRILNVDGRLVRTVVGQYEQGNNTVVLRKSDLGAPGVYYYELETPKFSARKKMVLIN